MQIAFESRGDFEVLARSAMTALPPAKLSQLMTMGAKQSSPENNISFSDLKAGDPFDTTKFFSVSRST